MENEIIYTLTETFEGHAQATENGVEYWLARNLQHLLGYSEWRNFANTITKAKTACEVSGHSIDDHFVDVNKMVDLGSGSKREEDHPTPLGHPSAGGEVSGKVSSSGKPASHKFPSSGGVA